jgi:hypothetical protein
MKYMLQIPNGLDAHDLTIATGAIEWIVEVSGPSSSGRR